MVVEGKFSRSPPPPPQDRMWPWLGRRCEAATLVAPAGRRAARGRGAWQPRSPSRTLRRWQSRAGLEGAGGRGGAGRRGRCSDWAGRWGCAGSRAGTAAAAAAAAASYSPSSSFFFSSLQILSSSFPRPPPSPAPSPAALLWRALSPRAVSGGSGDRGCVQCQRPGKSRPHLWFYIRLPYCLLPRVQGALARNRVGVDKAGVSPAVPWEPAQVGPAVSPTWRRLQAQPV